jgi:sirohydrochlorin cobaltochelatase
VLDLNLNLNRSLTLLMANRRAVILVGHGAVPKNYPYELVSRLKRLEVERRASGGIRSQEEADLDSRIRHWPRTIETDPYQAGMERVAAALRPHLKGMLLALAYNEFCAPTLEEAAGSVVAAGATEITVLSSMLTPGGLHAEIEIPEVLQQLRLAYPNVALRYAWPFEPGLVADMLATHLRRFLP